MQEYSIDRLSVTSDSSSFRRVWWPRMVTNLCKLIPVSIFMTRYAFEASFSSAAQDTVNAAAERNVKRHSLQFHYFHSSTIPGAASFTADCNTSRYATELDSTASGDHI